RRRAARLVHSRTGVKQRAPAGERSFCRSESGGMIGNELTAMSIADLQSLLRRREVSSREVIDALRERIEAVDGEIGAYLSLDIDAAIEEAERANVDLPLGGTPIAIKD